MPTITKREAYLKRGGHEMAHIMSNVSSRRKPHEQRPATVANFDFFKYGHSKTLTKHNTETSKKFEARARPVLKQRYVGYPVAVPDLSEEAVNETVKRRSIHNRLLDDDDAMFKKKYFPECTSDYFNQKHLIRDYLSTMHPYSDPDDRGRTYTMPRLKSGEQHLDPMEMGDFLQPEDPTRPRSVGYTHGHVRSMLHFDNFGPHSAERNRHAREVGMLPDSPNIDREAAIEKVGLDGGSRSPSPTFRPDSPGASTVSTVEDEEPPRRRRPTTSNNDTADMYLPHLRPNNYASNNLDMPGPDYDHPLGSTNPGPVPATAGSADQMGGLMPDQSAEIALRNARAKTAGSTSRPRTADEDDDNKSRASRASRKSQKSQTSRGGYRPTPAPPNPNTQTGTLGYHGKAAGKPELMMVDPISRGIEWHKNYFTLKKSKVEQRDKKDRHRKQRVKIDEEVVLAQTDFKAFEKALEFRRTAKPSDLPENNTRRKKASGQSTVQ
jgi:hypothetical protein